MILRSTIVVLAGVSLGAGMFIAVNEDADAFFRRRARCRPRPCRMICYPVHVRYCPPGYIGPKKMPYALERKSSAWQRGYNAGYDAGLRGASRQPYDRTTKSAAYLRGYAAGTKAGIDEVNRLKGKK